MDYATNLVRDRWSDTDLGEAFRAASANPSHGYQAFFDFQPYGPSHGAPASFISTPILDEGGQFMGALVFQMPIDRLNGIMQAVAGLGETGETYIVGRDHLRRSDSRHTEEQLILEQTVKNAGVEQALAGAVGVADVIGASGEDSLQPIRRWSSSARAGFGCRDRSHRAGCADRRPAASLLNAGLLFISLCGIVGTLTSRTVTRPLSAMTTAVDDLIAGRSKSMPGTERFDEIGDLGAGILRVRQAGCDATRIKFAMDNADINMMVADANHDIVYVNEHLLGMFRAVETELRLGSASFRADCLVGSSIDHFHKNPEHQHSVLAQLNGTHKAEIQVGGRNLTFTANPVRGADGEHLGTVVEWRDMTEELSLRRTVESLLDAANQGDFSRRIEIAGVDGTMARLAGGINQLTKLVEGATKDLNTMLGSLADGGSPKADHGRLPRHARRTQGQRQPHGGAAGRDRRPDSNGVGGGRESRDRDQQRHRRPVAAYRAGSVQPGRDSSFHRRDGRHGQAECQ